MRLNHWLLAVVAVGILGLPVMAQPGGGGRGSIWENKSFQDELKIDADKAKKAQEAATEARKKADAIIEQETEKALKDVLSAEQIKRYKQISFQRRIASTGFGGGGFGMGGGGGGMRAPSASFAHEAVATALKLTKEQQEDVKKLNEDYGKAVQAATKDLGRMDFEKRREATQKVSAEYMEKFQKTLTDDQKKTWDDVHGKPFTMVTQRPTQ